MKIPIVESYDKYAYESEYKNGKKDGKGKEYLLPDTIKFEGEYSLDYKKNGKEYYSNGELRFEGEFLFGKYWNGKCYNGNEFYEINNGNSNLFREYDYEGSLKFEGEYINGKKNGKGKEYNFNLEFEGEYINNKRNGKGKEYIKKGEEEELIFEGEYINGNEWNGFFFNIENNNEKYEIKNGNGFIKKYNKYGKIEYEGEYLNGKRNGKGIEYIGRGSRYEGEFLNGKKHEKE